MSITTTELMNQIKSSDSIESYVNKYNEELNQISFTELLNEMLISKNMNLASVIKQSGQSDYVYKVFRGDRKPSRDIIIAISIGMNLDIDETQLLLRVAKFAILDPRDKRDSVILYGIKETMEISKINELLYELNQVTL